MAEGVPNESNVKPFIRRLGGSKVEFYEGYIAVPWLGGGTNYVAAALIRRGPRPSRSIVPRLVRTSVQARSEIQLSLSRPTPSVDLLIVSQAREGE